MSAVYTPYKQKMLDSSAPDLTTVNVKIVLVDGADYTIDLTNHDFLDDVPSGGRVATSGNLASKTITGGVFDAADLAPAFTAATGDPSEYVVLYHDSGSAATSTLLAIWDAGTGLPVTPNGGDINVTFDNGANKIFKL
jgi:hypothetical protein